MARKFGLGLVAAVALAAASTVASAQPREFVVAAWGDPYEAGWRKSLVPEFEKANNAKIVWVQGFSSQTLAKIRAQKDNPEIDVAMLDDGPHRLAAALGLVEKLDRAKLADIADYYDVAFEPGDFSIGFGLNGTGIWYMPKVFAENKWAPPSSWADLFRPEFKGKLVVHNVANSNGLSVLLALNKLAGGTDTNYDAGYAKMKELAPAVVTFDKFGETPTLVQQGAAVVGGWSIDRVANLATTGVGIEFAFPKEGVWGWKEVVTIVKGRKNQDLAYKWINLMMSKDHQEKTAEWVGLGPVNKKAVVTPETARRVLYGPDFISKLNFPNWEYINEHRAELTERWNKEIERR
jgi:putative spermidine/putrescine transport system substrate-binding protein